MLATIAQAITPPTGAAATPPLSSAPGRPAPTRTAASSRPESSGGLGLDGWLVDRLFGR
jgi:penicillin-binding protein 1A